MRIFILYSTVNTPFGGANQFIRALKEYFISKNIYTKNIFKADIIFINSHSLGGSHGKVFLLAYLLKLIFPRKLFVQRVDGPVQLYGGKHRAPIDDGVYMQNKIIIDATIYQSHWSVLENKRLGMSQSPYEAVIHNSADPRYFHPPENYQTHSPVRLIATSWSNHLNKGFDVYEYLDKHLDWNKFCMTFVGRAPKEFKNIKMHPPVPSKELGDLLREHDIYVTASKNDSCSNSLIEALACGLPSVARNSGGHPELVGYGGELFNDTNDLLAALNQVSNSVDQYREQIEVEPISKTGSMYTDFLQKVFQDYQANKYSPKKLPFKTALRLLFR